MGTMCATQYASTQRYEERDFACLVFAMVMVRGNLEERNLGREFGQISRSNSHQFLQNLAKNVRPCLVRSLPNMALLLRSSSFTSARRPTSLIHTIPFSRYNDNSLWRSRSSELSFQSSQGGGCTRQPRQSIPSASISTFICCSRCLPALHGQRTVGPNLAEM